jgi:hypothetical protein
LKLKPFEYEAIEDYAMRDKVIEDEFKMKYLR